MPKAKQRFSWTYNHETGIVTCHDKVLDDTLTIDVNEYPEDIREGFAVYAVPKRLQELESGTPAEDKFDAYCKRHELFLEGKWDKPRQTGGPTIGAHITHIMRTMDISAAAAQAAWRAKDKDWQEAFKIKHKDAIEAIKAETDEVPDLDDMI